MREFRKQDSEGARGNNRKRTESKGRSGEFGKPARDGFSKGPRKSFSSDSESRGSGTGRRFKSGSEDGFKKRSFGGDGEGYKKRPAAGTGGFKKRSFDSDDRGEKRPYQKRDNDSFTSRESRDGEGFKKRSFGFDKDGEKRPFKKRDDNSFSSRRDGGSEGFKKRSFGFDKDGEKRPFKKRDDNSFSSRRDGASEGFKKRSFGSEDRGERKPFKKSEGDFFKRRDDDGFQKRSFKKDGDSFVKRAGKTDNGFKKRFSKENDDHRNFSNNDNEGFFRAQSKNDDEFKNIGFDEDNGSKKVYRKRLDKKPVSKNKKAEPVPDNTILRLNKYLASRGLCSRREADIYIQTGCVTVNGVVVSELGSKVNSSDDIRFNGEPLESKNKVYILLNKPKDYITTTDDPEERRTVFELIKNATQERVYTVGRLDRMTTGVLLFTNDGDLTEKLTHPKYNKKKIYQVELDKALKGADFSAILEGFDLEDGFIQPDALSYIGDDKNILGIEIHSGRNRIVRRIFEHFGYTIKKLDRVYFAGLTKKNLQRGQWRYLTPTEIAILKKGAFE